MQLKTAVLVCALPFALPSNLVAVAPDDPAALQVQALDGALLKSMQAGAGASITDRYHQLESVVQKVFDLPLMTRLAIGPGWTGFSVADQQAVIAAFSRLTIASYAHNFREFSGEKFQLDDKVVSRNPDKIVKTQIIPKNDAPSDITYRLRESGGSWKIIDVIYGGVSELTLRRSDFTAALAAGGVPALIAHLKSLSDGLMTP